MIQIEFFHDVICSFCFPMSAHMRQISSLYPQMPIVHRSFALAWEEADFLNSFGSRRLVTSQVLPHWASANRLDPRHRMNLQGMQKTSFDFPLSKPGLLAAKAAGRMGGEESYWDAFDSIQQKLFIENQNIEDEQVLREAIIRIGMDPDLWSEYFHDRTTEQAVLADFDLGRRYGIYSAPTLVINQKYVFSGVQSPASIQNIIQQVSQEAGYD